MIVQYEYLVGKYLLDKIWINGPLVSTYLDKRLVNGPLTIFYQPNNNFISRYKFIHFINHNYKKTDLIFISVKFELEGK